MAGVFAAAGKVHCFILSYNAHLRAVGAGAEVTPFTPTLDPFLLRPQIRLREETNKMIALDQELSKAYSTNKGDKFGANRFRDFGQLRYGRSPVAR